MFPARPHGALVAVLDELREHVVGVHLPVDEYDDAAVLVPLPEQLEQGENLLALVQHHDVLVNLRGALSRLPHDDLQRLREDLLGKRLDRRRKRGGEERRLPVRPDVVDDGRNLGAESQVEHAVGLVDDHEGHPAQVGHLPVADGEHFDEPPRGPAHDFRAPLQRVELLADGSAAVDGLCPESHQLGELRTLHPDLVRQLPGGCDNENDHSVVLPELGLVEGVPDGRQQVGERLARPGFRNGEHVAPAHERRDALHLDRKRLFVVAALQQRQDGVGEPTLREVVNGPRALLSPDPDVSVGLSERVHLVILHGGDGGYLHVKVLLERLVVDGGVVHFGHLDPTARGALEHVGVVHLRRGFRVLVVAGDHVLLAPLQFRVLLRLAPQLLQELLLLVVVGSCFGTVGHGHDFFQRH
ncbi:ATP-dependent RNA helicase [Babesia caballi]|uniref:ATP-dependent RNA helicase n=1 Tax=Babesia caballi TaxID=5871 RepID=A0AAV4M2S4_BABCB|nr:ATP-dependent RNA helicase [Babesia caballi]